MSGAYPCNVLGDTESGIDVDDQMLTVWGGDYYPASYVLTQDEARILVAALTEKFSL